MSTEPRRCGLKVDDPCSEQGSTVILTWLHQQAALRAYKASIGDMTPTESTLNDKYGNTKVIDPTRDYTIADLYDLDGRLLP